MSLASSLSVGDYCTYAPLREYLEEIIHALKYRVRS